MQGGRRRLEACERRTRILFVMQVVLRGCPQRRNSHFHGHHGRPPPEQSRSPGPFVCVHLLCQEGQEGAGSREGRWASRKGPEGAVDPFPSSAAGPLTRSAVPVSPGPRKDTGLPPRDTPCCLPLAGNPSGRVSQASFSPSAGVSAGFPLISSAFLP